MGEVLHLVAVSQSIFVIRARLEVSYLNLSLKQTLNIPVQHVSLALNVLAEAKLLKPLKIGPSRIDTASRLHIL
jgi:hypothetical protein